jgi:hypothetical protein
LIVYLTFLVNWNIKSIEGAGLVVALSAPNTNIIIHRQQEALATQGDTRTPTTTTTACGQVVEGLVELNLT